MKITIIRLGLAIREKEDSYNVQEIGLAKALNKVGHMAQVVYFDNKISVPEKSQYNTYVTYYPCFAVGHQIVFAKSVLSEIQCDSAIIFCDNKLSTNCIIDWCNERNIPLVCYFGLYSTDSSKCINIFLGKLISRFNYARLKKSTNVTKTNSVKRILESKGIPVRSVIPVGLDMSLLSTDKSENEMQKKRLEMTAFGDEIVLLFVGRLIEVKKPLMAIRIMEHLNSTGVKASLILIGTGPQQESVKTAITESKYCQQILYKEKAQYSEMYKYYLSADYFLNFSDIEIFGMAILEAMYYRCRVLAHIAPGPNDIIEHGKNGFLLDNYDINQWCKIIVDNIRNLDILNEAENCIKTKYCWDAIGKDFISILESSNGQKS